MSRYVAPRDAFACNVDSGHDVAGTSIGVEVKGWDYHSTSFPKFIKIVQHNFNILLVS